MGTWPSRLRKSQMRQFCGTWTWEWLLWQGPEAIVRVNYRPALSSGRALHSKKPAIVKEKKKIWSWAPDGSPKPRQTGRLIVGYNSTSTSEVSSSSSYIATDGQSASLSWCRAPFGAGDQILNFFEWQFLSFSYRVPSLMTGQVCNLQCNDASSSSSYIATHSQSARLSWCRAPEYKFLCLTITFLLLHVVHPHLYPPWKGWSSPKSKSR
jgi:hypothetical protein